MDRPFRRVVASGFFDPLHAGHVSYLRDAKRLGDSLIVILNADSQRTALSRTPIEDRKVILEELRCVDEVVMSVDHGPCVCKTLASLSPAVFAKGSAAAESEVRVCKELGIQLVQGCGVNLHMHDLLQSLR